MIGGDVQVKMANVTRHWTSGFELWWWRESSRWKFVNRTEMIKSFLKKRMKLLTLLFMYYDIHIIFVYKSILMETYHSIGDTQNKMETPGTIGYSTLF